MKWILAPQTNNHIVKLWQKINIVKVEYSVHVAEETLGSEGSQGSIEISGEPYRSDWESRAHGIWQLIEGRDEGMVEI